MDEAEREKLTLLGIAGSAIQKCPGSSWGELKAAWNEAVDERLAAAKAEQGV